MTLTAEKGDAPFVCGRKHTLCSVKFLLLHHRPNLPAHNLSVFNLHEMGLIEFNKCNSIFYVAKYSPNFLLFGLVYSGVSAGACNTFYLQRRAKHWVQTMVLVLRIQLYR